MKGTDIIRSNIRALATTGNVPYSEIETKYSMENSATNVDKVIDIRCPVFITGEAIIQIY